MVFQFASSEDEDIFVSMVLWIWHFLIFKIATHDSVFGYTDLHFK